MNRFGATTHPAYYWAIGIAIAVVFAVDSFTRIGVATWILYLIPLMMCFRVWQPWIAPLVAAISTVLLVLDWFVSAPGMEERVAQINRGLGIIVMWVAAYLAHQTLVLRQRLRRDDWVRSARTRIGDAILGEQSLPRLADRVLKVLVEHLGAQAGAMYAADATGAYARVGALGVPVDSSTLQHVKAGEGLLGRVVAERKPLRIDDLPPDYLKITSGLGGRQPHALLIAPLNIEKATSWHFRWAMAIRSRNCALRSSVSSANSSRVFPPCPCTFSTSAIPPG